MMFCIILHKYSFFKELIIFLQVMKNNHDDYHNLILARFEKPNRLDFEFGLCFLYMIFYKNLLELIKKRFFLQCSYQVLKEMMVINEKYPLEERSPKIGMLLF